MSVPREPFALDSLTAVMDLNQLVYRLTLLIPLVLSLTVHEWAHAWSAHKLGDDTAARAGRLTLNPLSHIDLIGTVLLPLAGIPFGWAKPVPIDPRRFNPRWNMRTGMALTAAAGPLSNLLLAVLSAIALGVLFRTQPMLQLLPHPGVALLRMTFVINVGLAVFNMLPVPPLDGSRILARYIPLRFDRQWAEVERFGPLVLMGLIVFSNVLGFSIISGPMGFVLRALDGLTQSIAG